MVIFTRTYDYLSWILPVTNHFPKAHRHTFTRRLMDASFTLYEVLMEAQQTRGAKRSAALEKAAIELDKVRVYLRLAERWEWLSKGASCRLPGLDPGTKRGKSTGCVYGSWIKSRKTDGFYVGQFGRVWILDQVQENGWFLCRAIRKGMDPGSSPGKRMDFMSGNSEGYGSWIESRKTDGFYVGQFGRVWILDRVQENGWFLCRAIRKGMDPGSSPGKRMVLGGVFLIGSRLTGQANQG